MKYLNCGDLLAHCPEANKSGAAKI